MDHDVQVYVDPVRRTHIGDVFHEPGTGCYGGRFGWHELVGWLVGWLGNAVGAVIRVRIGLGWRARVSKRLGV
jgi:hypothetical protein